jgi:uncharacterized membrane protein
MLCVLKLAYGEPFLGHITLITFGFILFIIGFQLISLGLLGEMIIKEKRSDGHEIKEKVNFK